MEKLAKVLKAVMICYDENMKCSDCPYNNDCGEDIDANRMLMDVRELYTQVLSGSLARRIVEEAQTDGTSADDPEPYSPDEPAKHLTCEDVEDCINLLDEIRSILVSGQYHGDDSDDEPEDPSYFSSGMNW